mgnify:CR=1 FL=1
MMTDDSEQKVPEARVRRGYGSLMSIWIVPVIALGVAAYLIFQAIAGRGTEVSIIFDDAEGMVPGKTQLKYKDVNIGQLSRIDILDNDEGVSLIVDVDKSDFRGLRDCRPCSPALSSRLTPARARARRKPNSPV